MVCPSLTDGELLFLPFPIHVFTIVCHLRRVKFCPSGFCISEVENLPKITHMASIHQFSYWGHGLGFSILSRSLSFCWRAPRGQFSGFCAEGAALWEWKSQWAPRRMSIWFDSTPLPSHQWLPYLRVFLLNSPSPWKDYTEAFFIGQYFHFWQVNSHWPASNAASISWASAAFCKKQLKWMIPLTALEEVSP